MSKIVIQPDMDGTQKYHVQFRDGHQESLSPDAFTQMIVKDQSNRNWMKTIFNITSPLGMVWVAIGLLGQVLFTGRMIVQWIASEKSKRSVVPTAFWWMSLIGASMLITYFIWRKDVVGILGQATGWGIYVRNLYLIYAHKKATQLSEPPEGAEATAE
ncbi:MAG: lipid-A-disaccharide synthase N-terminal domain-containing protein [Phycisphaeraceae bacterium]|nr:lipid-A-disaccharide synthase N-terminal domain-containing protein [Phycisphaeraceae bacterium]